MANLGNTTRPAYVYDAETDTWLPIGVGAHSHDQIPASIVDAKGDLIVGTAADTVQKRTVGADGSYLVADSTQTTGLNWAGPSNIVGKNAIINGGMDIWQRGTSFTVGNTAYLMDRWYNTGDTNLTVTRDTDVPTDPYFQYSAKLVGAITQSITQKIESANSQFLAGKTVTISLYAKKTSGTGALNINLYYPSAKDNFASLTQIGSPLQLSSNPGSSWTRYSVTVTMPSNIINGLAVLIDNVNSHTIFVTGVQVELGSTATPFSRASGNIQAELAACQRYYFRNFPGGAASAVTGYGFAATTTRMDASIQFPVPLRVAPISYDFSGLRFRNSAGSVYGVSSVATQASGTLSGAISFNLSSSATSASVGYIETDSGTSYLGISAEL
jgi:hypothetical protein